MAVAGNTRRLVLRNRIADRNSCANSLVAIALSVPATVLAAPAAHELHWTRGPGAEQCIDQASLGAAVEVRLGRPLHAGDGPIDRVIEGRVDPIATGGYRVRISVEDDQRASVGERELVDPSADCRDLDDKLVLVIALIVDPDRGAGLPGSPTPPPPTPEPAAATPAKQVPTIGRTVEPPRASVVLGASGETVIGVVPGLDVLGQLSLTVDPASLPAIAISLGKWADAQQVVAAGGVRFTAISAGASVCPGLGTYRGIKTMICLGGEVVRLGASGFDFDANDQRTEWIIDVTGEVGVTIPIRGRWSATAGIGSWLQLDRPRFVYTDGSSTRAIFQSSVVAGVGRIGLGVRL